MCYYFEKGGNKEMKRFILINSPIFEDSADETEQYLSPLGLGYIATYLEKANIDVELKDCVKERKSVSDIISYINKNRPDYVGINIFSQNYEMVKQIVEGIDVKCECFVGGQVVKSIYHEILQWNIRNKLNIIIGEGEFIIPQLVLGTCIQLPEEKQELKFVYRVNKDSPYFPADISNIYLNRKYMGNEIVTNPYGEQEIAIITSRGCPYNCAFCGGAKSLNEDVTIRFRNEKSIINEITELLSIYPNIRSVRILDDLFLRNAASIDRANHIFEHFPQLSWRGMVHVLSLKDSLDKIKELKVGKCRELFVGIESGSERIRKRINKLGNIDDIIHVSQEILSNGINLKGYFIYGFPGETQEDFEKTFKLANILKKISSNTPGKFRTSVFQFRPYHGTQLYNEIMENTGIIQECKFNESISLFDRRAQFNFDFGNYSMESKELLNKYIIKTQRLAGEK